MIKSWRCNIIENFKIYLAGGMQKYGKESFKESNTWRGKCINEICKYDSIYKTLLTNPNDYFNFIDKVPAYKTQREVMEFNLNMVRNADLIIVNFNDVYSLGTMAEIATAYERRIPIIGLNENNQDLHPWQTEMCNRIFDDIYEMLDYVKNFYLS